MGTDGLGDCRSPRNAPYDLRRDGREGFRRHEEDRPFAALAAPVEIAALDPTRDTTSIASHQLDRVIFMIPSSEVASFEVARTMRAAGRPLFDIRSLRQLLLGLVLAVSVTLGPVVHAVASAQRTTPAWVQVSVATVWYHPWSPRPVDAPALGNPARIADWLTRLSVTERLGLDSRINTQVLLDQEVLVLAHRGRWSEVEVPDQRGSGFPDGIIGWVPNVQLSAVAPQAKTREVIVSVPRTWLYAVAKGMVARRRFLVSYDTELPVVRTVPGYLVLGLPAGEEGAIADNALSPVHIGAVSGTTVAEQARQFLGLPYLWGGTSAFGYDCSGLVYSLYAHYGLYLPRDAADQRHAGTPVALAKIQPGDLLFFAGPGGKGLVHHVAIYVGGGRVIDSPYTGASVEIVPMTSLPVWDEFAGAIRVTLASTPA